jgi:type II secretory pathway predicted ATPase ExeA
MLARIRKAVVGAVTSGLGAGLSLLAKAALDGSVNAGDVSQAAGAAAAAALVALAAVYAVRNARTVNGPDPASGTYVGN